MPEDDEVVRDDDYRWQYLSTVVSTVIIVAQSVVFIGGAFGVTQPVSGGTWMMYNLAFLAAVGYALGPDMLREAQEIRDNGGGG